jgi:tRNA(Ile)-lysidine synthase
MPLSAHIADFLNRHELQHSTGVIAVSGGPDSVALAHLLIEALQSPARLIIAHVNHQLRGDESDADEAFVLQLAVNLGVSCKTTRIDVAALASQEQGNLEAIARRERYAWLTHVACDAGAAWIATGHTADDQAETVLFRLLRGSGVTGLSGMSETRPLKTGIFLVRPLLGLRRRAIHDYLADRKISYCIDSSNRDLTFTRNRLRLELLPRLEVEYNSAIVDVLCRLAEQAQELASEIEIQVGRLLLEVELPRAGEILVFSAERLQSAPANLARELYRHVWQREGWPMGDMDFERWHKLVEITTGICSACDFPGGIHARRAGKVVQVRGPARNV